eukprot:CAMPEP_0114295540 /NCGR_PEP_ID=MMETSP0059-20121206/10754_1 /TAXON_ID=36894 /ORGANISM="Pyramimonas parkeae, Strain CCMP726" /LENGTH=116 /DNA_ID=CAMNT_0001417471 /DNA_START=551 /DNA_END=901 /DNA_ORIENTATION=+
MGDLSVSPPPPANAMLGRTAGVSANIARAAAEADAQGSGSQALALALASPRKRMKNTPRGCSKWTCCSVKNSFRTAISSSFTVHNRRAAVRPYDGVTIVQERDTPTGISKRALLDP